MQPVGTFWRGEKSLACVGNLTVILQLFSQWSGHYTLWYPGFILNWMGNVDRNLLYSVIYHCIDE
jgi:hypothetical protein